MSDSTTSCPSPDQALSRREFTAFFSAAGLGGTLLPGIVWARIQEGQAVTREMLAEAEKVAGLSFTDEERELMLAGLSRNLESYAAIRSHPIPNDVLPALQFDPMLPGQRYPLEGRPFRHSRHPGLKRPDRSWELAFWPITKLSELVRARQLSSVDLTRMYLERLKRHGPTLECVVTLTEELALEQAARADRELDMGRYRGPLHGIPWGAKDLLAARGYRTTWGAKPYEDQVIPEDATVVRRLEEAGAVLVAKLTLGALAMGDVWFGGRTRNPWNPEEGSSGSSAGSAAATVAGLVAFAVGSETLGSIVSPSTTCGATGLRPTFGRVSRHGAMALSWSMDKLGPICRSVEDCALVLNAIHGADGKDPSARNASLGWDPDIDLGALRVGFLEDAFGVEGPTKDFDSRALAILKEMGLDLVPVKLPGGFPVSALRIILNAEAAAAFDELTRSGRDDLLVRQTANAWPNSFRRARMIPAVEYIQANRIRTMVMGALASSLDGIDVLATPSYASDLLLMTNLTGHPAVVVPNGFTDEGTPVSFTFIGRLWGEAEALAVAKAYQDRTGFHERIPPLFAS